MHAENNPFDSHPIHSDGVQDTSGSMWKSTIQDVHYCHEWRPVFSRTNRPSVNPLADTRRVVQLLNVDFRTYVLSGCRGIIPARVANFNLENIQELELVAHQS